MNSDAVDFLEWVNARIPPQYDCDWRPRFTLQVGELPNEPKVWIETLTFNRAEPKFYTSLELYEYFKREMNEK